MMATWMMYGLLVSALLLPAAFAAESALRLVRRPVRWVWAAALSGVLLLTIFPLRESVPTLQPLPTELLTYSVPGPVAAASATAEEGGIMAAIEEVVQVPLHWAAAVDASWGGWLVAGWFILSTLLVTIGAATLLRYRAARRGWPVLRIAGYPVRVAPAAGPAVIGVLQPEVVIPSWLLSRTEAEQEMVIAHEREHLLSRDPLLLAAGCALVMAMPWNLIAWWMLHRLRMAVEMDCDGRVLRRGVKPFAYGKVLIDLAGRSTGLPLGAAALAASPSTLERRIIAMTARTTRGRIARVIALAGVGATTLFAACEARMPTGAEIEEMDVAAAEWQASKLLALPSTPSDGESVHYVIDGVPATAEKARALAAEEIATIEVRKGETSGTMHIRTKAAGDGEIHFEAAVTPLEKTSGESMVRLRGDGVEVQARELTLTGIDALLFIDGVRA